MDSLINVMCTNSGSLNCICVKARPLRNGDWISEPRGAGFNADCDDVQFSDAPYFRWVLVLGLHSWQDHVGEVVGDQALHSFIFYVFSSIKKFSTVCKSIGSVINLHCHFPVLSSEKCINANPFNPNEKHIYFFALWVKFHIPYKIFKYFIRNLFFLWCKI